MAEVSPRTQQPCAPPGLRAAACTIVSLHMTAPITYVPHLQSPRRTRPLRHAAFSSRAASSWSHGSSTAGGWSSRATSSRRGNGAGSTCRSVGGAPSGRLPCKHARCRREMPDRCLWLCSSLRLQGAELSYYRKPPHPVTGLDGMVPAGAYRAVQHAHGSCIRRLQPAHRAHRPRASVPCRRHRHPCLHAGGGARRAVVAVHAAVVQARAQQRSEPPR